MSSVNPEVGVPENASATTYLHTVLTEFCDSFQAGLQPILDPLQHATERLEAASDAIAARQMLPELRDTRHAIQALVDKVAEQQAYVLIFGPLKSGKSTFMNSLSAAYVSEVTSLPAYPCMVYVTHSDEPSFVISRYDGKEETLGEREALRQVVADGHHDLRQRIVDVEAAGEVFDPGVHMPDAIRRIDIKIPIDDLSQSGAVLVDTPGLYTRMKFGYDRMTRDFRNTAACAIFIVKTDNLFFEQVFDEFGELLELFSRIFLLVNVDSTKKDLRPDGSLAPSLEQESPWEVIEAFEHLSMTPQLKKAFEEERLAIYPVDLLRAASRRIRARAGTLEEREAVESKNHADFDDLLSDLTEFLNSNEYLTSFLHDSSRRAQTLIGDLNTALEGSRVQELANELATLEKTRKEVKQKRETLERLQEVQWRDYVVGLTPTLTSRVAKFIADAKGDAAGSIHKAVGEWFENPQSLHDLVEGELRPVFTSVYAKLISDSEEALTHRVTEDLETLAGGADLLADLKSIGIDMRAVADSALGGVKGSHAPPPPGPQLPPQAIPVRRRLVDWLLLRSAARVSRSLFGPSNQPDTEVAAPLKARLLGERGREIISDLAVTQLESQLNDLAHSLPNRLVRGYAERTEKDLRNQLKSNLQEAKDHFEDLEKRLSEIRSVHEGLHALTESFDAVSHSVDDLVERFGRD